MCQGAQGTGATCGKVNGKNLCMLEVYRMVGSLICPGFSRVVLPGKISELLLSTSLENKPRKCPEIQREERLLKNV